MAKRKCNINLLCYVTFVTVIYGVIDFHLSCHCVDEVFLARKISDEIGKETVEELTYNEDSPGPTSAYCGTFPNYPRLDIEEREFSCTKAVNGEWQEKIFSHKPVGDLNVLLHQNCTNFVRNRQYLIQVRSDYILI